MGKLFEKVSGVLREQFEVLPFEGELRPELSLEEDLGLDSLDHIEFVMALEEKFNIIVPEEDSEKFKTLEDIVAYLDERGVE